MGYSPLSKHRHDSTPIKSCECMKSIICLREKDIVHPHFVQQSKDTPTVQEIVDFVNRIICYAGVVLVSTWTRNA